MDTNDLNDDYFISSVSDESADSHLSAEGYIEETDHNRNNNNNNNHLHNNNHVNHNAKNTNHHLHHNGNNNDASKYNSVDDYLARLWHVWSKQWKQTATTTTTTTTTTTRKTITTPRTTLHTLTKNSTLSQTYSNNNNNNNINNNNNHHHNNSNIARGPNVLALANNYEDNDNVNIALIDSSETLLVGSNDDYAAESMQRSMVRGINRVHKMIGKNATLKQIFDGGGVAVGAGDDGDGDDESGIGNIEATSNVHTVNNNYNNIARDKSENGVIGAGGGGGGSGGSSFMLLFEDLGDYFYNYNGSMVSGTTTAINNSNFNDLYNRTNCTNINIANTTVGCYDFIAGEFLFSLKICNKLS